MTISSSYGINFSRGTCFGAILGASLVAIGITIIVISVFALIAAIWHPYFLGSLETLGITNSIEAFCTGCALVFIGVDSFCISVACRKCSSVKDEGSNSAKETSVLASPPKANIEYYNTETLDFKALKDIEPQHFLVLSDRCFYDMSPESTDYKTLQKAFTTGPMQSPYTKALFTPKDKEKFLGTAIK